MCEHAGTSLLTGTCALEYLACDRSVAADAKGVPTSPLFVGCLLELPCELETVLVDLVAVVASQVPQRLLRRCKDTRVKRLDLLAGQLQVGHDGERLLHCRSVTCAVIPDSSLVTCSRSASRC